jgi:FAD:protein FMN transferase
MGSTAHVLVTGPHPDRLLERAAHRLAELEGRWSRFRPDSEISRLNAAPGEAMAVSDDTLILLCRAVLGWRRTGHRFDPTVHAAMVANGYDRDFALITAGRRAVPAVRPAPGCASIHIDLVGSRVRLPAGVRVDPGGIGKGLAADLVAQCLVRAGATGVLVNVGGDLRVAGTPADGDSWPVRVADPFAPDRELVRVGISTGAVASSGTLERRWRHAGIDRHHIIDPRSGLPVDTPLVGVTVFATSAWWAEVLTKAIMVGGSTDLSGLPSGVEAIAVDATGARYATAGIREALSW